MKKLTLHIEIYIEETAKTNIFILMQQSLLDLKQETYSHVVTYHEGDG